MTSAVALTVHVAVPESPALPLVASVPRLCVWPPETICTPAGTLRATCASSPVRSPEGFRAMAVTVAVGRQAQRAATIPDQCRAVTGGRGRCAVEARAVARDCGRGEVGELVEGAPEFAPTAMFRPMGDLHAQRARTPVPATDSPLPS